MKDVCIFRSQEAGKMHWVEDPNQGSADNLKTVRHELKDITGTKRRQI